MEDEVVTPTSEETEEETTEEVETQEEEEEIDWKAEALKAKELAENQKRRAEKAEKLAKTAKEEKKETTFSGELSQTDLIYLAKSDINEEDIADVTDWAKFKGISIKEAHEQLKPTLSIKQEQRTTAAATETKSGRGVKPKTGEDYLEKARRTGEVPTDEIEMQKLILARQKAGRR